MRAGNHRRAVDKYREAVALEPEETSLRFALATAYSFLDRRAEAIEEFRLVVQRADRGGAEYREARRWLAEVGAPIEAAEPAPGPAVATDPAAPFTGGRLVGSTEWPGIDPTVRAVTGEISITGAEPATEKVERSRPLRLGAPSLLRHSRRPVPARGPRGPESGGRERVGQGGNRRRGQTDRGRPHSGDGARVSRHVPVAREVEEHPGHFDSDESASLALSPERECACAQERLGDGRSEDQ